MLPSHAAAEEPSPHAEHQRLVRAMRLLVAAERDLGVLDLLGTTEPVNHAPLSLPPAQRSGAGTPFGDLESRVAACTACPLCKTRTQTVFGEGAAPARLAFCGDGPGFDDDRSARPFVGAAGELLTAMIEKGMRMHRQDVYILNAVKCRPPQDREPLPAEIAACRPFLEEQIAHVRPEVVVALGSSAVTALLGAEAGGIAETRGREFRVTIANSPLVVVPTFHPSELLRTPAAKREAWADLQLVMRLLASVE